MVEEHELLEQLMALQDRINEKLYGVKSMTVNGVNIKGHDFEVSLDMAGTLWPGYQGEDIVMTVIANGIPMADIGFKTHERLNVFTQSDGDNVEILVNGIHKYGKWQ